MPVFNNILAGSSGQGDTGYEIEQSVRFDEDNSSAYLYRTPSGAGNRKTFTISFWFKYCPNADTGDFFIFEAGTGNSPANYCYLEIYQEKLYFRDATSGSTNWEFQTSQLFRDVSAWYHCVIAVDTTQASSSNRVKIYLNGSQITAFGTETQPSQDYDSHVNNTVQHAIGASKLASNHYFDGYLAEFHLIDGTALTPASFGETNSNTNQWQAIEYDGSYGTNGFYQKYAATGGHTSFTSSGSWTAPTGVTSVDYLVVGGGGGGASGSGGGGGGAGAFRSGTLSVTPGTTYSITVGAGGAGGSNSVGANGSDSVFSSITSNGGGGGGTSSGSANGNASGGGGGNGGSAGAGGTYGNAGGAGGSSLVGGGGGGASAAGTAGVGDPYWGYGHGGAGSASSITGSSVTYSGGGGGGVGRSGAGGNGGSGGGGSGAASSQTPGNGTANTGGGGGGSNATSQAGGTGGSGIVVIKIAAGFGLGLDSSGNGNNFTETNLVATDQVLDSPTNNFCTLNPLNLVTNTTLSEGNLKADCTSSNDGAALGTMAVSSGKWYWEVLQTTANANNDISCGVMELSRKMAPQAVGADVYPNSYLYGNDGWNAKHNSTTSTINTYGAGDIIGWALDLDGNTLKIYKNNSLEYTYSSGVSGTFTPLAAVDGTSGQSVTHIANFGQDSSFNGEKTAQGNGGTGEDFYYSPPTGFKALNTDNLPDPSIADPTAHFNTVLWSGSSSAQAITGVGFAPTAVWTKRRNATGSHYLWDTVRGNAERLEINSTGAEETQSGQWTSFDSDGFTLPGGSDATNNSGGTYVGWNWKAGGTAVSNTDGSITSSVSANPTAGFSILTYTGNATAGATVGHGLSQAPELVINKVRGSATQWYVNATAVSDTSNKVLMLNDTGALDSGTIYFNDTDPTATLITLGSYSNLNSTGSNVIYCWHSVEGYSKVGSYTGNANADGPFVYTGFRPAFLMVKGSSQTVNWDLIDAARNPYNILDKRLAPNTTGADDTSAVVDFLSNGFKVRTTSGGYNDPSSATYIYLAFAESPFKTSNAR